jgi:pre-mRNA-splicing factor ATP-dependent RNA helicase DHX15/PRP43
MDAPRKKQKVTENPYLAHLPPSQRGVSTAENPLGGFVPGNTTAKQAEAVENGDINPFALTTYSDNYRAILKKRRDLPVTKDRQKFLDLLHKNQVVILVGETGSGKTTQYVPSGGLTRV